MEIGKILKNTRESKGISLETVEENIKIRRKYLEAIENEDFEMLPGRVYSKGFIRNYARFLGLNAKELVSAFEECVSIEEIEESEKKISSESKTGGQKLHKIAIGGLLMIMLMASYIYLPSLIGVSVEKPSLNRENIVAKEDKAAPEKGQVNPVVQQGVQVILSVTDNSSWVYVEVDGKPAFTGLVPKGEMKEFKGNEKISLKLGNAGVVEIEHNGQKIGVLGTPGQVVTKEFRGPQV